MTALNVFRTITAQLTTTPTIIYTSPAGKSSIVLMAQISNVTSSDSTTTVLHVNGATETELIWNFGVPGNDSISVTTGKLVLEEGHSLKASAGTSNSLKIVLSILETSN